MSCIQCNLHRGEFRSEHEFSQFYNLITDLVSSSKLIKIDEKSNFEFFVVRYKCSFCNTIWVLSIPDQAYRGGWHNE